MQDIESIKARIAEIDAEEFRDFFGAEKQELIYALPFSEAKEWLNDDVTEERWENDLRYSTDDKAKEAAASYLVFAAGKATDHRGLSAERSVDHFKGFAFLLGGAEAAQAIDEAPYQNYGVPQLKKATEVMGIPEAWSLVSAKYGERLERMSEGQPCSDECYDGCGR